MFSEASGAYRLFDPKGYGAWRHVESCMLTGTELFGLGPSGILFGIEMEGKMPKGLRHARTKELDAVIGQNIRNIRTRNGLTQETLGVALGITFQQIQKYERGLNRVSAAALVHFQSVLGCELKDFFAGIDIDGVKNEAPVMSVDAIKVSMVVNAMPPWKQSLVLALTRQVDKADRNDGE